MPQKSTAPEKIIAIDFSGRIDAAGQRRHIWAAVWTPTGVHLESNRTRDELCDWLLAEAKPPRTLSPESTVASAIPPGFS